MTWEFMVIKQQCAAGFEFVVLISALTHVHLPLRPLRVALKWNEWMREQLREGHECICCITSHGQLWSEIPHAIPLLHLLQCEGTLYCLLRVHILPPCLWSCQLPGLICLLLGCPLSCLCVEVGSLYGLILLLLELLLLL